MNDPASRITDIAERSLDREQELLAELARLREALGTLRETRARTHVEYGIFGVDADGCRECEYRGAELAIAYRERERVMRETEPPYDRVTLEKRTVSYSAWERLRIPSPRGNWVGKPS